MFYGFFFFANDLLFTFYFICILDDEMKEMATHSSILAWRIPGTEEPGGLLSMGFHRVRHDWSDLAATADYGNNIRQKANLSDFLIKFQNQL